LNNLVPLVYLGELVAALDASLDAALRAVYLTGSAAVGAYRPGVSDLDVLVVAEPTDRARLDAIVGHCSHEALPCPAKKLELVVYEPAALAAPGERPRWSLNLDTGAGVRQVDFDPDTQPAHWFVLDLAFARRHALPLVGPPPAETIGDPGDAAVSAAFAEMVEWYEANEPGEEATLAALRARHWAATGTFAAKPDLAGPLE
jgi:nucleotidyltransferase-like protein